MKRTGWLHAHARSNDGSGGRDRPISIVWHLRTGDAVTAVKEGSLLALNRTVSRQLPHRRAVHTVLTADEAQLRVGWPALSAFCRAPSSVEADVALMADAENLELAEEIEFYSWLEAEAVLPAATGGVG